MSICLVPPDRPIIYETKHREKAKTVEAFNEGSDVSLICEVNGGKLFHKFFITSEYKRIIIIFFILCPLKPI